MQYDYVIIGGGTAGVVAAYRLAEKRIGTVLLIEAGVSDENRTEVLHLDQWQWLLKSEYDYDYTIEPQQKGNDFMRHSRAKVMGGCSSHNSAIAFQAPDHDFHYWQTLGVEGWEPATVRPFYRKVLEKVNVEVSDSQNACGKALLQACAEYGIPLVSFEQATYREGAAWFSLNKKGNIRQSSSVAYLYPYNNIPSDLTLMTQTMVTGLIIDENKQVRGVKTSQGKVNVNREAILSGGAFNTPQLLMLSGVGPAAHLQQMEVPTVLDLPGVGKHLVDHPEGVIVWEAAQKVPELSAQKYEIGFFCKTRPDLNMADVMFHFGTEAFDMNTRPAGFPTAENAFSLTPNVMQARSEGEVLLRSKNPYDSPKIDPKYFTDPQGYDEQVMLAGLKIARELARQPALQPWIKRELAPGPDIQDDDALLQYIYQTHNTVYHPAGTCKMGKRDDPMTVTDSQLRVKGMKNLRIADASVFPAITSVNPGITCMMIGERCADFILKSTKK